MKNLFIVFQFLLISSTIFAQAPQVQIISPENLETDISISPDIIIQTNYPIDTSTFRIEPFDIWQYPYPDSVFADSCSRDTIIKYYPEAPMVFFLPDSVYENEPDSLWDCYWILGKEEFLDSVTVKISYQNYYLAYYSNYRIVVRNFKVLVSGDTLTVEQIVSTFTTSLAVHQLISTSFRENNIYRCGDTLYFDFNRKLDSIDTYLGNIIELGKFCGETMIDSSGLLLS